MLAGPAAITGQLPGRSNYNNSVDTDAYGKLRDFVVVTSNFNIFVLQIEQILRPGRYSKTTRNMTT